MIIMEIIKITKDNFEKEVKESKQPVLVDFWAAWCGPCMMQGPVMDEIADEYKFQIVAMEVMPDHIHLLVDCKPQFYISDMIKIMKGNLARQLSHPELKRELWGGHLWNPSYCAVTVSDRSKEQVLTYIRGQKEKEAGK